MMTTTKTHDLLEWLQSSCMVGSLCYSDSCVVMEDEFDSSCYRGNDETTPRKPPSTKERFAGSPISVWSYGYSEDEDDSIYVGAFPLFSKESGLPEPFSAPRIHRAPTGITVSLSSDESSLDSDFDDASRALSNEMLRPIIQHEYPPDEIFRASESLIQRLRSFHSV